MNAADLTFGVEIECTIPADANVMVGGYHGGLQVPELPAGWKAERDGSIQFGSGRKAVEIVSPVLKGADGIRQVMFVLNWLRSIGAAVNRSTGFHVHVGFDARRTAELGRVVALVARHEPGLFAVTGTKSRERGHYCKPIKENAEYTQTYKDKRAKRIPTDRYCSLNLRNLAMGTKPTVEFRLFAGTLNDTKAIGYVRLCLGLVEKALNTKRTAAWDLAKNANEAVKFANTGAGRFATIKLVYGLGWKKGETATEFGRLEGEGFPSTDEIVKEFYRLANKYDGNLEPAND